MDISAFDSPYLQRAKKGAQFLFRKSKKERLPVTISQLQALVKVPVISKAEANRRAAYLLAFFACLRSGEFCYSTDDWNNKDTFRRFRTCRRDIQFSSNFDRMTLTLKSSKTSPTEAVRIEVAANHSDPVMCPVMAMRVLFHNDPQPSDSPLFNLDGSAFTRDKFHVQACQRLREAGFSTDGILPHSFRKGCAQWMHNQGFLPSEIKMVGRWTSEAYTLYVNKNPEHLFALSLQLQTRQHVPFTSASAPGLGPPPFVGRR
jgi:integrase